MENDKDSSRERLPYFVNSYLLYPLMHTIYFFMERVARVRGYTEVADEFLFMKKYMENFQSKECLNTYPLVFIRNVVTRKDRQINLDDFR